MDVAALRMAGQHCTAQAVHTEVFRALCRRGRSARPLGHPKPHRICVTVLLRCFASLYVTFVVLAGRGGLGRCGGTKGGEASLWSSALTPSLSAPPVHDRPWSWMLSSLVFLSRP